MGKTKPKPLTRGIRVRVKATTYTRKGKTIHRKGYTYTRKDVGKPGRGEKVIPPLEENELKKHGFSIKAKASVRRRALSKSVAEDGYRTTLGRVVALQVFFKNTKPEYSKRMEKDRKWLVKKYGGRWS